MLWDVDTQRQIGRALPIDLNKWVSAAFAPNGRYLFTVSDQGRGRRWDDSPKAWSRHACQVANRDLTRREWEESVPEQPYREICGFG